VKSAQSPERVSAAVSRFGRWLVVRFDKPHRVASWAIVGGGLGGADAVAWRQVDESQLRPPVDAARWLRARMSEEGLHRTVGLLTSRDLEAWVEATKATAGVAARCVATVGMGNALRAGDPPGPCARIGTINALVCVDAELSQSALIEGLAIATEAKTAAVLESGTRSRRTGLPATGTGTDCLVIAAPVGTGRAAAYAGKHTEIGAAIGAAVFDAVGHGVRRWLRDRGIA
jgi:adenosylcobinamide amidohydrolase